MRKILGITFGGLQKKTLNLVLMMLLVTVALFIGVSVFENRMLVKIVGEAKTEQQQAISRTSETTMQSILESAFVDATAKQAKIADNDFAEVVNNIHMLQSMAEGLFENRGSLMPAAAALPDASLDGTPSAMVLCEEGADYAASDYLGVAAHMSWPMLAMFRNSEKIDGLYIGLEDGTDLCVDDKAGSKLDENGAPIPFPVRQRPWYRGAVETGGVYFTGLIEDAFTGRLLITCSAPVYARGELVGVVGIDILLKSMSDFFDSTDSVGAAYVINDQGQVILATDPNGLFKAEDAEHAADLREGEDRGLAQFVGDALRETTPLTLLCFDGKEYYAAGAPMPTVGWAVVSVVEKELTELPERQMLEEYDRINEAASARFWEGSAKITRIGFALIGVIIVLGVFAALYASNRIVKPIEQITRSIVRSGQTGKLFEMQDSFRTDDEIELLAESFADLSKKTKKYIEDITRITAEKERIGTELALASKIQMSMIPHIFPPFPTRPEFSLYASVDPAREVGGDFYDFFLIDDDHLCLVIADVSGKGVPGALFMMVSKIILQSCAMLGRSAAEILTKTNEALCSKNQAEMFVTVWLGILEISTGRLTAANAGHEYPVFRLDGGDFELYKDKHGFVLGGMDGVRYREYELFLKPGDKLFVYTDGVPEASDPDNRMFGIERMLAALNEEPDAEPEQLLGKVRHAVDGFVRGAEQFDDLTMLCMEYKSGRKPMDAAEERD